MDNIEDAIVSSIEDAELPQLETADPDPVETTEEVPAAVETPAEATTPDLAPDATTEADKAPTDDFEKKYGIPPISASGRPNRIPYERVKKINEKAVNDAKTTWTKELTTTHVPVKTYQEVEAKVKDYEGRLTQVAEFEKVMTTDQTRFLTMLAEIPGYRELFQRIADSGAQAKPAQPEVPQASVVADEDFPQPDQELSDGSKVYSLEGLKARDLWNRAQARKEVMGEVEARVKQIEETYKPLKTDYDAHQKIQAIIPKVNSQIAEARTWPQFNENEDDIVKSLQANPAFSLERAYQTVVLPKMKAEQERLAGESKVTRESIRAEILKELKEAPRATSAVTGQTKAAPQVSSGPRSLEDVIADSIKGLK